MYVRALVYGHCLHVCMYVCMYVRTYVVLLCIRYMIILLTTNDLTVIYKTLKVYVCMYDHFFSYFLFFSHLRRQLLLAPGPRILTFFLYLSDVEEGGETAFPDLGHAGVCECVYVCLCVYVYVC